MKKHLCFVLILCLAISGLYAQSPCVRFDMPNLYPEPGVSQNVDIYFNNAGLVDNTKYAMTYTFYHNGVALTDVEVGQHINTNNSYVTIPFYPNEGSFSGQFISSGTGIFPNGMFETGMSMNLTQLNFLYGKYLKTNYVRVRMTLAWRSDRTYDDDEYTLVVSLVQMTGGSDVNKKYNSTVLIGGNGATQGETVLSETIATVKHVDGIIYDTICYSQIPYQLGRTTITSDTINKTGYKQPTGADFCSIVEQEITFGNPLNANHCNERIDSIATVRLYVWPELTLTKAGTGHNLTICDYATAGYVIITPAGGKAPYTVYAYKQTGTDTYETTATGSVVIGNSNPTDTIKGLGVGTYKLVCVDAAGCEAFIMETINPTSVNKKYTIEGTITHILCNGTNTGAIDITSVEIEANCGCGDKAEPITYQWSGPSSYSSTLQDISDLAAGEYTLVVTDKMGCTSNKTFEITQNAAIETTDAVSRCRSQLPYQHGDSLFNESEITNGTIQKVVHFSSVNGCDSAVTVTLTVYDNPTITFTGESAVCQNGEITISTTSEMSDYYWTNNGTAISGATTHSITRSWSEAGPQTISVNYTDGHGCRAVQDTTKTITVNPLPTKTVSTKVGDEDSTLNITACAGQTVTITAAEGFEYVWMKVGSADNLGSSRTLTLGDITSGEVGQYYAILTNSTTNCTNNSDTVTIAVNTPSVSISDKSLDAICLGNSQTLTAEPTHSNDGILYYKWDTDETTASIEVTPTSIGAKEYTVVVTDSIGKCSAKATATFSFTVKDTVSLTFHDGTNQNPVICLGNPITDIMIDSANCAPLTISPALPAGLTFANGKISGTPTEATTYNYTITATSNNGCTSSDKSISGTITVKDTVKLTVTGDTTQTFCLGASLTGITFGVTNGTGALTWANEQAPAGVTQNATGISGTPTAAGTYKYTYTATTSNGCTAYNKTITGTITVNDTVKLTITGDTTFSICPKTAMTDATQFTVTNGTIVKTGDLPEGLTFSTENAINGTPTQVGIFHYTITANSDKACSSKTMTGTITVYDTATLTVTGTTEQTFCLGGELSDISFVITNGEYDNSGTLPAGVTFGNNKISGTPTEAGEFTYTVKVKDANNCSDFDKEQIVKITVNDTVKLTVSGDTTQTKCLGEALADITFTVTNGTGDLAWTATPAGVTSDAAGISGTPTAAGTYKYTYTATSDHSCSSKTVTGTITVNDTVKLTVSGDTTFSICPGTAMTAATQFTVTNGTIAQTGTLPAGITFSAENAINGTPTQVGTFRYTITANSNNGCSAYDKIMTGTITVYDTATLTVTGNTEQTLCLGNKLSTINFAKTNGVYANTGTLPAGVTFAGDSISGTPTEYGEFTYTVKVVSANDCSAFDKTQTVKITVNDTVKLTVSGDTTQTKCLGEALADITFSVTNGTGNLAWTATPAGVMSDAAGISGTPTAAGTYKYTYTATSDHSCSSKTVTGTITVNDTVKLTVSGDTTFSICPGTAMTAATQFTVTNGTIAQTGTLPAGITFSAENAINGTPTQVGTFRYTITANSNNGCSAYDKIMTGTITVYDTATLTVTGNTEQTLCLGNKLSTINFAKTNGVYANTGTLPAGVTFAGDSISGTPTEYGEFTYTVKVVSANDCSAFDKTQTVKITVNDTVKLTVSGDTTQTKCLGEALADITFSVTNGNGALVWTSIPAGVTQSATGISGTPTAAGTYKYTYTATSNYNCNPKTVTGTITVNDTVVPTISANNNNEICVSASETHDTITLSTNITGTGYAFAWTLDGGTAVDNTELTSSTVKAQWAAQGTKNIGVAITTTATGCVGRANANIKVNNVTEFTVAHTAGLQGSDYRICAYDKDTLTPSVESAITYTWTPTSYLTVYNSYKQIFNHDEAGTYTYTVSGLDANNCQTTQSVTIIVDPVPTVTVDSIDVTCYGLNNGSLIATVTGGTGSYCYKWSDNNTNECYQPATHRRGNIQGETLTPGTYPATYTVTVTDIHGCTVTGTTTINEPAGLTVTKTQHENVDCYGGNNGILAYSATGGTKTASGNYNFKFNRNEPESVTSKIYSGLSASIDTIKVTDANGCSVTLYDTIRQPEEALRFSHYASKDADCHGDANGKIQFTVAGGWNPGNYNYTWKKGDANMNFNDTINSALTVGNYTITATDDSLCTATLNVTINEPEVLVLTATDSADIKCYGDNNGAIKVSTTGGNGSYEYKWDDNDFAAGITEKNDLTPGLHTVIVKDAKGCKDTVKVTIETPEAKLAVSHDSINPSCFGLSDGKIVVTVTGGRTPYATSWDNESGITATERTELPKGTYYFTVVDDSLCVAHDTIRLTEPEEFHVAISGISNNRDSLCAYDNANYKAVLTAAEAGYTYQYQWYKDDVAMTDSTRAEITNLSNPNGEYEYKVIVTQQTTSTPCTQKDSVVLTVLEVPNTTITALHDTICFGTEAKLTASGAQAYQWKLNGNEKGTAAEIAIEQAAGTDEYFVHNYELTGTNTYGTKSCVKTDDTVVIINNPYVTLTPMADQTICASTTATLAASVATKANDRLGYTWESSKLDGTNMTTLNFRTSTIAVSPTDTTVYYMTVTDTVGECTKVAYDTVIVNVDAPAVTLADITYNPNDTICLGDNTTLTASYTALHGEISYKWSANGTNRADTTVTPGLGENAYTVTATATIGTCSVTATKSATVVVNDTVKLTHNASSGDVAQTVCEGKPITPIIYTVENGTMGITWDGGNSHGLSFDATSGTISGTPTATTTYTLKATSNHNPQCSEKSVTHTITVNDTLESSIVAADNICIDGSEANDTLKLYVANLGTTNRTYEWNLGANGSTIGTATDTVKAQWSSTGSKTVTVTVTDGNSCKSTFTKTITVNDTTTFAIAHTATNATICAGGKDTLTPSVNNLTYTWTPTTDLTSISGSNAQEFTSEVKGTHTYTVIGTNNNNCSLKKTTTVTVDTLPTVAITALAEICRSQSEVNDTLTLSVAADASYNYTWTLDGGTAIGETNAASVKAQWNTTGTKTITVTVTNGNSCKKSDTKTITVNDTADFTITAKNGEICADAHDTLTVTEGYTYTWNAPSGLTMTNGANDYKKAFNGTPTTNTTYTVTVTAATDKGCKTTKTKDITVDSLPRPTITPATADICLSASEANKELSMSTQSNYSNYEWNLGTDGTADNTNTANVKAQWSSIGEKTVTVTVKDGNGCSGTGTAAITVKDTTTFAFTSKDGDFEICMGKADTLTATEGLTYTWPTATELAELASAENNSRRFTSDTKGVYNYNVIGVNGDGCQLTKTVTVKVDTVPAITLTPTDVLCYGESTGKIETSVTGGNSFTYAWTNSANETVTNINALPIGRYYVTVTNDYGCTATANDTIKQPEKLTIEVTAITQIACSYSGNMGSITVEAHGGKTPTYTYKLNDGDFEDRTPTWTGLNNGDYTITVKDGNHCTASVDTVIKRPAVLAITHDSINPTCFGATNGEITAHVTGGNEGALTYTWSNNGSNNETLNDLAAGKYTLQVNDVEGCVAHDTIVLSQPEEFSIAISGEDSICADGSTKFEAALTATGTNYTYQWYKGTAIGDETMISGQTSLVLSGVSEANTYYIVATQTNGVEFSNSTCAKSDTVKLTVLALPELVFTFDPNDTVCFNTPAIISVTGADNYSWAGGLGSDDVVNVENTVGIHEYEVTGTNNYGTKTCSTTAKDTVVVLPLPSATLTVNGTAINANDFDFQICEREKVTFSVPSQSGVSYTWKKGDAAITGEEGNELVLTSVASSDNGDYTVVVKNTATGCDSTSFTVKLTVNDRPDASIIANHNNSSFTSGQAVCAGEDVVLSIATTSSDYTYQWKKNGTELSGKTEASLTLSSIAAANAGEYTLYVKNTTTQCDTTTLPFILKVNELPVVTLSEDNSLSVICADSAFHFTVTSDTVISTYNWTRNDIAIEGTATLRTAEAGTYKVAVIDHNGCPGTTNELTVKVNALPVVSINEDNGNTAICADSAFHFSLVSDTVLVSYQWMRDDASISTDATIREAGLTAGSYTYTATVVDRNNCKVTTSGFAATVNALPVVTVNDEEICRNNSIALEATGANNYVWAPADSLSGSTGATVTFTSRGQGTFNIVVTGTDDHNCTSTDTATIKVNDLPGDGTLTPLTDKEFCKGTVSGFKVSGFSAYTWTCVPSDGSLTADNDTATFTGNTAGDYVVKVEVTDANGCKSSTSANVVVDTLPVPTITVDANVCVNGELEFTTEEDNVHDYVWTFDGEKIDSTGKTLKLKWDAAGDKTVTVNYKDNNNCTAATATSKTITVHALPVVEITEGRDSTICRGSSITLHATTGTPAATDYLWNDGVGDDDEVTVTPVTNDSTFVVRGSYEPVTGLTCASTDTITVHLQDTVKLTVSNATQTKCLGQPLDTIKVNYEAATLSWSTTFTEGIETSDATGLFKMFDTIKNPGTYTYVVTATSTNTYACDPKEETITLVINDTNKLTSTSNLNQTICLGNEIEGIELDTANCTLTFSPELSTKGLAYSDASHTITGAPTMAENFTVTVTATPTISGCYTDKTLEFSITVLDTNKLDFVDPTKATQAICLGNEIEGIELDTANCTLEFSPALSTKGLTYNATSHTITGTPTTAEEFTVTITATATNQVNATMPCNAVITREITIKVNDTVKIAATAGDNLTRKLCKGTDITELKLWATDGTIALGSGAIPTDLTNTSTASDTIKLNGTMNVAGTYNFYVVATGTACTSSKDSLLVSIVVDTIPFVAITPNVDTVCPNTDLRHATLTATAGYGAGYAWSCSTETANSITVVPENAQNIYTVTVTNGENCTATASDTIRLYTLSVSTISGDNEICLGESTTLTAAPDAEHTAASYEWIGIAGANTNEVTVSPIADSIFRVRVVDNNGCYDTAKITVTVDTLPNASITAAETTVCQNGTLEISADNAGSGLTYLWKDGNDSVFNARVFNFVTDTNTVSGNHTLTLKVTDGNRCVSTSTQNVTVNPVQILSETHTKVKCYGGNDASIDLSVRYKESIFVDNTYSWTKEGDASFTRNTEDISGLSKGVYNVTVEDGKCSATLTVTIEQPDTLKLTFAHTVSQLCSGTDSLTVVPVGGNGGFTYVWTTDGTDGSVTTDSILRISNLTAGIHTYSVTVTDAEGCTAYTPEHEVISDRIEVAHEINLGPGETYVHEGYTYGLSPDDEGKTFEVLAGTLGTGNCDSVYIYTVHMYGIGMNFTDENYTIRHSGYFNNYQFTPTNTFDTIWTSADVDNEFYAFVPCGSDSIDNKRIDMKYEIVFNDGAISDDNFTDYVSNLRMMSYYDHDRAFYGIPHIDSARGEMPGTTFLYQYPSNSTAYYFDYFNFGAFRNMPQKIQFNFTQSGTYTIKFTVEERLESTGGQTWGFYNPYVVNGAYGPLWGGRGDTYTGKKTITSRNMTVIVGEAGSTPSTPIVTNIDNYLNNTVPTVTTFPNPARDLLNLNISGMEGHTRITITDATGKLVRVYDENLLGNDATLTYDIATFSQGIYFINVYNNETILTNKFIVTK